VTFWLAEDGIISSILLAVISRPTARSRVRVDISQRVWSFEVLLERAIEIERRTCVSQGNENERCAGEGYPAR
jgi:hypothetical protein